MNPELRSWLASRTDRRPTVLVSFGTYFSAHADILRTIGKALAGLTDNVLFASGLSTKCLTGLKTENWFTARYLPQPALLPHVDAVICHGGNNTLTEVFTYGVKVLAMPFASDQFAGAEHVQRHGLGLAMDPNALDVDSIRAGVAKVLKCQGGGSLLSRKLQQEPGHIIAARLLTDICP